MNKELSRMHNRWQSPALTPSSLFLLLSLPQKDRQKLTKNAAAFDWLFIAGHDKLFFDRQQLAFGLWKDDVTNGNMNSYLKRRWI